MDIVLAVFAWRRGWKAWALLPIGIAFFTSFFIGASGVSGGGAVALFLLIALAELSTLGLMVAKPRVSKQADYKPSPVEAAPANATIDKPPALLPVTQVSPMAIAKLVLPDGGEITIDAPIKAIGRTDFDETLSPEDLNYISRQHLVISTENDKYFIEDINSTNGTRANGTDIRGKSRQELKDGDRIKIADVVELTFVV